MTRKDLTLVVFGHGSSQHADSGASVLQHARALRELGIFAGVEPAFWKQDPRLEDVLDRVRTPRVVVAPLFISEGYFSDVVVPEALGLTAGPGGRCCERAGRLLGYCRPAGTHPRMTDILLERAREVVRRHPFPSAPAEAATSLFIAGHGTARNGNSRKVIDDQAGILRAKGLYAAVHPVFIEESPRVSEAYELAPTRNLVVVPFFIGEGMHVAEDIPVLLGESRERVRERLAAGRPPWANPTQRQGRRVWYSLSAGSHPGVAEILLERVAELGF